MTNPTNPSGYWTPNSVPRFGGAPNRPPTNVWAWTGAIVSVSGFLFNLGVNGVVGLIFSLVGLREAGRLADQGHTETGRQLALVGIVTGIIHIVVTIAIAIASVLLWWWFVQWIERLPAQMGTLS